MTKELSIEDKYLYFPLILLGIYLLIRLIDQSALITNFPLGKTNDVAPYMTLLYFLANYGYHQLVPYWQGGFVLFQLYPPGWFYFSLPIYTATKNILVTTFISLITMLVIIFLMFLYFGKALGMSITKRIFFFIFLFANPISIGNFIRLSRVTELFGWMFLFFIIFICIIYKNRKIDYKFIILFIISYFLLMFSHPGIMLLAPLPILSLFLIKKVLNPNFCGIC